MTVFSAANLLEHPAFRELDESDRSKLVSESSVVRFRLGQVLADPQVLPSQVLVLLEGQARVLAQEEGRLITLEKLQPGDVVGLVSLLRASACEEVSAASSVVAASIPDHLIVELHRRAPHFRRWCQEQIWPSEIFTVMRAIWERQPRAGTTLHEAFDRSAAEARPVTPSREAMAAVGADRLLLLSSDNVEGLGVGEELDPTAPPPRARPPLPPRLLSLPADWLNSAGADGAAHETTSADGPSAAAPTEEETIYPVATALDLGQEDPARSVRLVRGQGPLEEASACFQMLAGLLKLPYRRDAIEKYLHEAMRRGQTPNLQTMGRLATLMSLHVVGVRVPSAAFARLQTPSILPWGDGGFALLVASNAKGLTVASPRDGMVVLRPAEIRERWPETFELLLLERTAESQEQRFNLGWFLPAIRRHRAALTQVLLASFVVQLFSLANPLLIQVIIDKVISQRSLDTLQVLGIALLVVTLLDGVLTSLRTFLFSETTNRIDMRLGGEVIDHLLRLPLGYFDRRPVGELSSRVAELEKVRNFLTGQGLTTVIDSIFSVIYIVVMVFYSWLLTIIALAVVPIQVGITVLGSPLYRRQLRQCAEENARTQAHLVEVVTGIQTVKAQNVEMVSRWKWQDLYSRYISRSFERTITGTALSQTSQVLQSISQLLVLWVGASLVLDGQLTLGQLIAFRIISGYVTQPLLRLSTIWQNIQELKVSMERLADVVDTPQESSSTDQQKIPLPPIDGRVRFEDVTFAFTPADPPVLKHISFDISPGTFVGVVGQSGSGKSTMMKLLPRLYSPQKGRILIDEYDIDKVELYSLRRQIGIVPQEPLLFSGSVSQNIALTDPDATSDAIVRAARLADAHNFIMSLPDGYSTFVGERGANLSGGQRQRIAIARTLLSNPKLLVMDEATSALDYETERRVFDNLRESLRGCTVFFITHRLSTIRNADHILLLHQGVLSESGDHAELMKLRGRYYALYRQQEGT